MIVKRVLFIDHTAAMGGGEIALLNLVRSFDPSRYQPVVLLFSDGPLRACLIESGIETHVLPMEGGALNSRKDDLGGSTLLRLKDVTSALSFVKRVSQFIRRADVVLVHTNSLKSDLIGGAAARLARRPLVWHVRDRIAEDYLPAKVAKAFRFLCRVIPTRVIVISEAVRQTLAGVSARRIVRVHDGTPLMPPTPLPSTGKRPARVGIVGRISPWKGQDIFLRAAAQVLERFPGTQFQIIGSALFGERDFEQELHEITRASGLAGAVEFTGFRSDVPELIAKLDILVHASTTGEPFGQVVIEGMGAGKPVVATRGGAIPEIVLDGQTGIIVPMGDPSAMAQAICRLISDPARAIEMGQAGRRRVIDCFTIERTAAGVQDLYDQIL